MECLFCKIINNEIKSLTLYENEHVKCFLDIHPNNIGHTLVVPKKHIADLKELDNETLLKINEATKICMNIIEKTFDPNGFKIIVNYGTCQDIKHYHLHIIPKYKKEPIIVNIETVHNLLKNNCF